MRSSCFTVPPRAVQERGLCLDLVSSRPQLSLSYSLSLSLNLDQGSDPWRDIRVRPPWLRHGGPIPHRAAYVWPRTAPPPAHRSCVPRAGDQLGEEQEHKSLG